MRSPLFFRALHTLAVDDAGGGTGLAFRLLAAFDVERVVNVLQRAGVAPQTKSSHSPCCEVAGPSGYSATGIRCSGYFYRSHPPRACWRAACHRHAWLAGSAARYAAIPRPSITRIAQLVAVVAGAVFGRPHMTPRKSVSRIESQKI